MNKQSLLCTLKSIGKCTIEQDDTVFRIAWPYIKALKQLSHFSHLIMFTHNKMGIKHYVCKAHLVNEKQGVIITDNTNIQDNTIIYDIKPYIPCEDRALQTDKKHRKDGDRVQKYKYENDLEAEDLPEMIQFMSKGDFKHLNEKGTLIMNERLEKTG